MSDGEVLLMHEHQIEPAPQCDGAILGGAGRPGRQGRGSGGNRAATLGGAHVRYEPELFGRGGVVHGQRAAVIRGHPGAVDEAQLAQQQRIFEFHMLHAVNRVGAKDNAFIRCASTLDNGRDAHAAGGADRDQAALGPVFIENLRERGDDARAGRGERVADREAAALHVELGSIDGAECAGNLSLSRQNTGSAQALSVHSTCPANASWIS